MGGGRREVGSNVGDGRQPVVVGGGWWVTGGRWDENSLTDRRIRLSHSAKLEDILRVLGGETRASWLEAPTPAISELNKPKDARVA